MSKAPAQVENRASVENSQRWRETFIRLFSMCPETCSIESEMEAKIAAMLMEFEATHGVNTDIDIQQLADLFKESRIPQKPVDASEYMAHLATNVVAHSIRTSSPRYIGHMTSSLPYFVRPLSRLVAGLNQNMVKLETAKAFSPLERQAIAMIHRLIYGFPDEFYDTHAQDGGSTLGVVVSGGTVANITALWCARNSILGPSEGFAGVEKEGLARALQHYGYKGAVVIGSQLMHYSFDKAAGLLGIGSAGLVKIPTDHRNRVDLRKLRQAVARCQDDNHLIIAIVGIAGSTDCGSIDPLFELAEIAAEARASFHADAAWGGPLLFSRSHREKLAGIELADSVTIDAHKQMYLPVGIGLVMMRDPRLASAIEKHASYIIRADSIDLGKRSLEGSRPASTLLLHAALSLFGCDGFEFLLNEGLRKAAYMTGSISSRPEFELLAEPDLNIISYRFLPEPYRVRAAFGSLSEQENSRINEFNERLQKTQHQQGQTFVSRTTLRSTLYGSEVPIVALRAVIANPLTTEADIDSVLDHQVSIAATLS